MKNLLILLLILILSSNAAKTDKIVGIWLNEEKSRAIKIYKMKNEYVGIMHWIGKPDPELKEGKIILKELVETNGKYKNGRAFVQKYGWIKCEAEVKDNILYITGSKLGIKRVRKFTVWKE
ncbi:DUF2147 domain-containing protein [Chryseobacterium caseinilyticum]|uniref:DUF2147 domain-containing protein n=1 Tax=Chryseobacterium caseinilyticum TaxID=2771428 RepID=A0ABR8ZBD8_9FLAO|nr:hypothetical protein [Chryseobacterium caseinilyticum]MBD8082644.1 hypothetical protein [Chryseobacterium caseinilyticum]